MDYTDLLNQVVNLLLPILATVVTGVFTYVGTRIKSAYETKVKNDTTKVVIADVVKFVEQVYADLDGKEKLAKAVDQTSQILEAKGIIITEAEINMLIESAVYSLKNGLTEVSEPKQIEE